MQKSVLSEMKCAIHGEANATTKRHELQPLMNADKCKKMKKQCHHLYWTLRLSFLDEDFGASSSWTSGNMSVHECSLAV
jgi:hypothetical protein